MSTAYYRLRHPVTALRRSKGAAAWTLYDKDGARVGTLRTDALLLPTDRQDEAAHGSGGTVSVYAAGPDAEQVISEYGEVTTLGELRVARQPSRRTPAATPRPPLASPAN